MRGIENTPSEKPVFVCDVDSVLVDPRIINAHWLPGEPNYTELPAEESAMAEAYGMELHEFYRKKDIFLNSFEARDVPPIKDSPEVLGLIAVRYNIVFASARVPNVYSSTLAWLEEHYGEHVAGIGQPIGLFNIGNEHTYYIDSKESIYRGVKAKAMIDDRRQHHLEAVNANVPTRIYYQDSSLGGETRGGKTPEGSTLAVNFSSVREIILPEIDEDFDDACSVPCNQL